jgi:hypothetical protein
VIGAWNALNCVLPTVSQLPTFDFSICSRDPIWTLETGSLFLWKVSSNDLFRSDGLQFFVWDFDKMSQDEVLGWFTIPPSVVYGAKGERLEYKLKPPPWSRQESVPGYLAVRCRRASEYDKRFMKEYVGTDLTALASSIPGIPHDPLGGLKNITKMATESAGGSGNLMSMIRQNTRVVRDRHNLTGTKQVRTKNTPIICTNWLLDVLHSRLAFRHIASTAFGRGRIRSATTRRPG